MLDRIPVLTQGLDLDPGVLFSPCSALWGFIDFFFFSCTYLWLTLNRAVRPGGQSSSCKVVGAVLKACGTGRGLGMTCTWGVWGFF